MIETHRDIEPFRDLAILFCVIYAMPVLVLLVVAIGAACESILRRIFDR